MPKKMKNKKETKTTKGFTEKIATLVKSDHTPYTLKEVKDMAKKFNEDAEKNKGKYIIRGRNIYKDNLTIRAYDGTYFDAEGDEYYNARGYDKKKYDRFYTLQIVYVK